MKCQTRTVNRISYLRGTSKNDIKKGCILFATLACILVDTYNGASLILKMYWKMYSDEKAKFDREWKHKRLDLGTYIDICKDFCTENYLLLRVYYRQIGIKWQPSNNWCDWLNQINTEKKIPLLLLWHSIIATHELSRIFTHKKNQLSIARLFYFQISTMIILYGILTLVNEKKAVWLSNLQSVLNKQQWNE